MLALKFFIVSIIVYVAVRMSMNSHDENAKPILLIVEMVLMVLTGIVFFISGVLAIWTL